jgi:hypothetical protein
VLKEDLKIASSTYTVALVILLLAPAAFGQTDYKNLKSQAEEGSKAFVGGDYGKLADLTYPKLVELIGGRAKMIAYIEKQIAEMKAQGAEVISVSFDDPTQVIKIGGELFAVLPDTLKMKVPDGILVGKSFMLGISGDNGEHWTFVDGSSLDEKAIKTLFPAAAGKLNIPKAEKPVLYAAP